MTEHNKKTEKNDIIAQNKVFIWIALATILFLMIPFFLMEFRIPLLDPGSGYEVINWGLTDFIVAGSLIFVTGSIFVLTARIVDRKYRGALGIVLAAALMWLWAELAVGIFTDWGN